MYQRTDTTDEPIPDPALLDRLAREGLSRIQAMRERLFSQLCAASWSVEAACEHAREGDLKRAQAEAARAGDLLYAATESKEPIASLLAMLGGSACRPSNAGQSSTDQP